MGKYRMQRSYEGFSDIPTDDLLTAVKYSINYEADLYIEGKLLVSWLGFEMEYNIECLEKQGITTYIKDHTYKFKYTNESKTKTTVWVDFMHYFWGGEPKIDVRIFDYQDCPNAKEFNSLDEVIEIVKRVWIPKLPIDSIHIRDYSDNCKDLKYLLLT